MLILNSDVRIHGLRPEMNLGITIINSVFEHFKYDCIITSAVEGKHSRASLHYNGCAVDLRIRHLNKYDIPKIKQAMVDALGPDFDVVLEGNHFHIEYQPKSPY